MHTMEVDNTNTLTSDPSNMSNLANGSRAEPDPDGWVVVERKKEEVKQY